MKKTMTFALVHFTVAFTVTSFLTGDLVVGSLVALIEPLCNTVAYFFHEKFWESPGGRVVGKISLATG